MTTILVTGGTGTLGRLVVERLTADGHDVRVLSRHSRPYAVDLRAGGPGLDTALDGVDTVVHCASAPRGDEDAARHLITAARRAGVGHLVYISIVGVDRVPLGYYKTKLAVERLVEESGLDWTVLRTTQFHDLILSIVRSAARLPVMPVPSGVSSQPIETAEVADRLAGLASAAPAGRVPDMGGPEALSFREFADLYLRASGRRRLRVPLPLPGRVARALREGGNLAPERAVGKGTFAEFLTRTERARPSTP